jgi:hypothetical protein
MSSNINSTQLRGLTETFTPPPPEVRLCLDCDEPIPQKRLDAVPDARYCVYCQPAHTRLKSARDLPSVDPEQIRDMVSQVTLVAGMDGPYWRNQ